MRDLSDRHGHPLPDNAVVGALGGLTGRSSAMREVFDRIRRVASSPVPIVLCGETGTGKDVAARVIHQLSGEQRPYVALNCAAIPRDLVESELFGHASGAFTGAARPRAGLMAQANGGTLFLDEIAELCPAVQAKLLRALDGEFRPLGSDRVQQSRFRVVAATNSDLDELVKQKQFRLDLLHRLGAIRITLPPLRDRTEDLPLLADDFLIRLRARRGGVGPSRLTDAALALCAEHPWPGNVRQFEQVITAVAATTASAAIEVEDVREFLAPTPSTLGLHRLHGVPTLAEAVDEAEAAAIRNALALTSGDRVRAAALLGVSAATLYRRLGAPPGAGHAPRRVQRGRASSQS